MPTPASPRTPRGPPSKCSGYTPRGWVDVTYMSAVASGRSDHYCVTSETNQVADASWFVGEMPNLPSAEIDRHVRWTSVAAAEAESLCAWRRSDDQSQLSTDVVMATCGLDCDVIGYEYSRNITHCTAVAEPVPSSNWYTCCVVGLSVICPVH